MKLSYIYFMANRTNKVLYIGVTKNLVKRVYEHKTGRYKNSFSEKYNCKKLVYLEEFTNLNLAIDREKQLKAGNRKRKNDLVQKINPEWKDLSEGWVFNV